MRQLLLLTTHSWKVTFPSKFESLQHYIIAWDNTAFCWKRASLLKCSNVQSCTSLLNRKRINWCQHIVERNVPGYLLHYFMIWKAEEQIQSIWGRSPHVPCWFGAVTKTFFFKEKIKKIQQKPPRGGSLLRSLLHLYLFSPEHRWQCSFLFTLSRRCPQSILRRTEGKQSH